MSKKKKRNSKPAPSSRTRSQGATLADEKAQSSKRFNPTARNILFGDLVLMAVAMLLTDNGLISDFVSGLLTIVGLILILVALWFQFGKKDISSGHGFGPRNNSGWPGL